MVVANEKFAWTNDAVTLSTRLWKDGASAEEIAKRLGNVSRNAVIGKMSRLGLKLDREELKRRRAAKGREGGQKSLAWRGEQRLVLGGSAPMRPPVKPPAYVPEPIPALPSGDVKGVSLEDRTGCIWPFGDLRIDGRLTYCDAPCCRVRRRGDTIVHRTRYCSEHWDTRRSSRNTEVVG